jgi:hypothetical protein
MLHVLPVTDVTEWAPSIFSTVLRCVEANFAAAEMVHELRTRVPWVALHGDCTDARHAAARGRGRLYTDARQLPVSDKRCLAWQNLSHA